MVSSKRLQDDWEVAPVLKDLLDRTKGLELSELKWIPRTANKAADWITVQSRQGMCPSIGSLHPHPLWSLYCIGMGLPAPPLRITVVE